MPKAILIIILIINCLSGYNQSKSITDIKKEIENAANSPLYVKDVLKKRFKLDTVVVTRTVHFNGIADSLAYLGQLKKVYGPYTIQGQKYLLQILARLPNTFYRISQIYIDTSIFRHRVADSLGKFIVNKLKNNSESFEQLSQSYSMGGEDAGKGDIGWVAKGSVIPVMDKLLAKSKKGDVFMFWSGNGLHIIMVTEQPKQDNGAALMMRIYL